MNWIRRRKRGKEKDRKNEESVVWEQFSRKEKRMDEGGGREQRKDKRNEK